MTVDTSQMTENKPYPVAFTEVYRIPECYCLADNQVTVHAEGFVEKNKATVSYKGSFTCVLQTSCDLCLKPVEHNFEASVSMTFSHLPKGDNPDILPIKGGKIEVDLLPDILMNMPMKVICSDDCKGICESCGCNLNIVNCSCKDPDDL